MRKKTRNLIIAGVFILLLVATVLRFFVSGRTVANLFSEYENYEVIITKSSSIDVIVSETVLTSKQKEMLKDLLSETSFRRVIADFIYTSELTRYEIRINGTHQTQNGDTHTGVLFLANSTGGEYLLISNAFNGKHLKIYNNQWNARIDEIIALSSGD